MEQVAAHEEGGPREDGAHERGRGRAEEGERSPHAHEIEGEIHAQHEEIALGEVDHPHHPEDEAEAHAHEPVDAAEEDAGDEGFEKSLGEDSEAAHPLRPADASGAGTTAP